MAYNDIKKYTISNKIIALMKPFISLAIILTIITPRFPPIHRVILKLGDNVYGLIKRIIEDN